MAGFVGVFVGCFGSVFDSRARAVTDPVYVRVGGEAEWAAGIFDVRLWIRGVEGVAGPVQPVMSFRMVVFQVMCRERPWREHLFAR